MQVNARSGQTDANSLPDKALILQSEFLKLRSPEERIWTVFSEWFQTHKPFVGHSGQLLLHKNDFATLSSSGERDALTSFLEHLTGIFFVVCALARGMRLEDLITDSVEDKEVW